MTRHAALMILASYAVLVAVVLWASWSLDRDLDQARTDRCDLLTAQLALSALVLGAGANDPAPPYELTAGQQQLVDKATAAVTAACA